METRADAKPALPPASKRVLSWLGEKYFTVDLRTLAAFRIAFGIILLRHLFDTAWGYNGIHFYTDLGPIPAWGVLKTRVHVPEWGFLFGVTTPGQLRVAFVAMALVYLAYTVGWHTRLMQWLVVLVLVSLGHRNTLLQNGGVVAMNTAAVFSAFLPVGARFSLDALGRPPPERPLVTRFAYGYLVFEYFVMHFLNALAKNGANWRNGSAIHDMLWLNRFVTPLSGVLRMHEPAWFSPFFSNVTRAVEYAIPFLILLPFRQRLARRFAIYLAFGLHFTISRLMVLGPFSYLMMAMSILLVAPEEWADLKLPERAREWVEHMRPLLESVFGRARTPYPPTEIQGRLARFGAAICDGASVFIAVSCVVQICHENPILPKAIHVDHRPAVFSTVVDNLQLFQMWHMFAPQVFFHDGSVVVDGVLEDGTHVDPFTGLPPDFDQPFHGPLDYGQPWCDYFWRIGGIEFNKAYRPFLRDYLFRAHTIPGTKIDRPLKRFDAYWVSYDVPPMGSTRPRNVRRTLVTSSEETPAAPMAPAASPSPPTSASPSPPAPVPPP
jgi:hypothetical protein